MFSYDPIEGMDYIFNRYAYLGLPIDADKKDIGQAIKVKRASVHADRLLNVHEDVVKQATAIRELVDQCAEILLNDELRPLYTERLKQFLQNKPQLVSDSGNRIVSTKAEKFDLDFLLAEKEIDLKEFEAQVQAMTGYNPKKVAGAKKLYALEPDAENRGFLVDSLNLKLTYLGLMEEAAWAQAGVINFKHKDGDYITGADQYMEKLERAIAARRDSVAGTLAARGEAVQIGLAQLPLLLQDMRSGTAGGAPKTLSADVQAELAEKAGKTFAERTDLIRKVAQEKKEVLAELLDLMVVEDLGVPLDTTRPYFLFLMRGAEGEALTAIGVFEVDAAGTITMSGRRDDFFGKTTGELKAAAVQGAVVESNKEVDDPILEIGHAAKKYADKHLEDNPPRPVPDTQQDAPAAHP